MKTQNKKARFLHQDNREYRGLRSVQDLKTKANRIERRTSKQEVAKKVKHGEPE